MNGEIKITCEGPEIAAEVKLEHVDYEDRMNLLNVMLSIINFDKDDLLLFLLQYGDIKDSIDETTIDLSALHGHLSEEAD